MCACVCVCGMRAALSNCVCVWFTCHAVLSALGQDTLESWPPYLSNLVFELWQLPASQGGHHVVRVLYNREELELPHCPPGE